MWRSFRPGLALLLALAAAITLTYPKHADEAARTLRENACVLDRPCNRVTGTAMTAAPGLIDRFFSHPLSRPTR